MTSKIKSKKQRRKILILCPYPVGTVGSQRFRFEQYLQLLLQGVDFNIHSFYSRRSHTILYKKGHYFEKSIRFIMDLIRVLLRIVRLSPYDFVLVHREVVPVGPPLLEWWIAKVAKKKIVYDFDDAIWTNDGQSHSFLLWLKQSAKFRNICRWSYRISCGNQFLAAEAKKFNPNVIVNPTTIDTNYHQPVATDNQPLIVGWTGSHSTLQYLYHLWPVLKELKKSYNFDLKVICDRPPALEFPGLIYASWDIKTEIDELNGIDIGVMPLIDSTWTRGKCGFKILQYMALAKVAIASNVGVNSTLISHGINGILCSNLQEWKEAIKQALTNEDLRKNLGEKGRERVINEYSVESNWPNFRDLFT